MEDFFEEIKNRPRPNFFRRIWLWWNHDGKYYHKYFKNGVKNLWYWLPIIWKDRNWDSHYIFEVLKHKLKSQAKYISDRNWHTRAQQDARRMRLCVSLIEKVQDETYAMEYMDYGKDRVWLTPCNDGTGNSLYNSEIIEDNYSEFFKKYPLIYQRVMKGEGVFEFNNLVDMESKKRIAMNIAHINHNRARKLLFKIMESEIEKWWD